MKIINEYKFKNNKVIRVYHISDKDRKTIRIMGKKIPNADKILLAWEEHFGIYMRADEALIVAKQLIDAVYKIIGGYNEKLLKGYYGYKESKL